MNKKPTLFKIILNSILTLFLLIIFFYSWTVLERTWELLFYLTFWSLWMDQFYITSITICDIVSYFKITNFPKFNSFIRNTYIRIVIPYAISVVFLYWMLILLGNEFQPISKGFSIISSIFLHGLVCFFVLLDAFWSEHLYIKNYLFDILIISIIYFCYILLLGIGKYILYFDTYDFMILCNERQISFAAIIIYVIILDGFIVFQIIAYYFFIKSDDDIFSNKNKDENDVKVVNIIEVNNMKNK